MTLREKWDALVDTIRSEYASPANSWPWVVKYSGGKDSAFLQQAVSEALLSTPASARTRMVYVVHNDTLVENPVMQDYARAQLRKIEAWAKSLGLPLRCVITEPDVMESFWFCLIGLGYPTPWRKFRWCTSRLKIRPGVEFMRNLIGEAGEVMVLIGTRSDESDDRARSVRDNEVTDEARLSPDPKQLGARRWQPIKDFTTEEVWETLLQRPPPWPGTYRELQSLYASASESDACQLIMTEDEAEVSCGTGGRMGCWTCTVVPKDKSLVSMVAKGREDLEPLIDFRNWLISVRNDPANRERFRRNGHTMHDGLGKTKNIGPFTLDARERILSALLALQDEVKLRLIRDVEVVAIRDQWKKDALLFADRTARGEALLAQRHNAMIEWAKNFRLEPT